ncbi:MAG: ABC transporter ATP-binding protein [Candidatus Aminicenantes bacterium]|nr:ABC transporter ATP-binding protein [Candidatus Aminicenantes bacterium]
MIRFRDLHKSFGPKRVLSGLDLEIRTGETLVVIGQSGSGKSVLLKLLIGILDPDRGAVFVDDVEVTSLGRAARQETACKFGMLFQAAALFDSMNVGENVAFGLKRRTDLDEAAVVKIVADSLTKVGLKGIEHLMPHELSGGMRKRVGLARAIAYQPEIILYDEPSTGLDPIRADAINDLILFLQKEMGVTSIVITHDMVSAKKVADRIAMLYDGRIIAVGTPDEIRDSPDPVVQQFLLGRADGPIKNW